jgi:hypothetical protein
MLFFWIETLCEIVVSRHQHFGGMPYSIFKAEVSNWTCVKSVLLCMCVKLGLSL